MRKSNIELLRILCMFMIILWHINIAVEQCEPYTHDFILKDAIYSITVIAVNCFVLISGYFGIHFKIKSIVILLLQCLFYSIILGCTINIIYNEPLKIMIMLMPVSSNTWWFVTTYFMLYLSAPLLNKAIENMNIKEFIFTSISFTLICVYCGYIFKNENNPSGHSYLQFVYIYIIGRAIYKMSNYKKIIIGGGK